MHIEQDLEIHTGRAGGVKLEPRDENALRIYYVVPARNGQRVQLTFVNNGEIDSAVEFEGLDGPLTVNPRGDEFDLDEENDPRGQVIEVHGRVAFTVSRPLTVRVQAAAGTPGLHFEAER